MTITYMYKGGVVALQPRKDRPAEVDTTFLNEDGFKRNLYKFQVEWVWSQGMQTPAGHGWIFTKALNWMVSSCRHMPFNVGHAIFYWIVITTLASIAALII
jgi:hypothetical protein